MFSDCCPLWPLDAPPAGPCQRCAMVCVEQKTGIRSEDREPFATLASYRRNNGKITFGVLMSILSPLPPPHETNPAAGQIIGRSDLQHQGRVEWMRRRFGPLVEVGAKLNVLASSTAAAPETDAAVDTCE